jgi:hypothetical protein
MIWELTFLADKDIAVFDFNQWFKNPSTQKKNKKSRSFFREITKK